MINKIDGSISLNIGGENRKIKFSLNSLIEVESYLPNRHLFQTVQNGNGILSISVLAIATWVGLKYQDKKLSQETVVQWVEEHLQENELQDFHQLILGAMGILGTLGDKSVYKEMLAKSYKKEDENTTEGKQETEQ